MPLYGLPGPFKPIKAQVKLPDTGAIGRGQPRRLLGSREPQLSDLGWGHRAARVALSCLGVSWLLILRGACGSHSVGRRHTQDGHLCLQLGSCTGKPARALGWIAAASLGLPLVSASWPAFSGSCPGASPPRAPSWVRAPGHAPAFQLQRWRPWGSHGAERSQLSLVIRPPFSGQTGKRTFLCGFTVDCVCAEDFAVIFREVRC